MEDLIDSFYRKKSGELVRFCRATLSYQTINGVDAEDIVQKVVVKAWEKRDKLATHPNVMGWFLNACLKECKALFRAECSRRKQIGPTIPLSDDIITSNQQDTILRWIAHQEATDLLTDIVKDLTPLEQSVFTEYYIQEKTAKEAADTLGLKVGAVNDAARRIRKKASTLRFYVFLFLACPICQLLRSIFNEGRQW